MDEQLVARLVHEASRELGLPPDRLVQLGGATGRVFGVDDVVLRVSWPEVLDHEQLASTAAAGVVPVPEILGRYDSPSGDGAAALIRRAPGADAAALDGMSPDRARRRGRACGAAQAAIWTVPAPAGLAALSRAEVGATEVDGVEQAAVLLHLDLHPLNILLGEDDEVTAVIDWTNAAAGPAAYDRARTASIFHLDPHAVPLLGDPTWRAFLDGWTESAQLDSVPAHATAWACRYMLDDVAGRYDDEGLRFVQAALAEAEAEAEAEVRSEQGRARDETASRTSSAT